MNPIYAITASLPTYLTKSVFKFDLSRNTESSNVLIVDKLRASLKNINLGAHFLLMVIFENVNF